MSDLYGCDTDQDVATLIDEFGDTTVIQPRGCVRPATLSDAPAIVRMAEAFIAGTAYRDIVVHTPASLAALVAYLVQSDAGVILVCDLEGTLAGFLAVAVPLNIFGGPPVAEEVAWWVEPAHRKGRVGYRLLGAAETWARQKGVSVLKMVAPAGSDVGLFYERRGYALVETVYQLRL